MDADEVPELELMRHPWEYDGAYALFPQGRELTRELTIRDLVDFGEQQQVRLPSALVHALTQLRQNHTVLCRAVLQMEGEHVAHLTLKIVPSHLHDPASVDAIYEAIEGAGTERLVIRAHLTEQNVVYGRGLAVDAADLFDTAGRESDEQADSEEAWLVVTMGELFDQHFEETDRVISAWQAECGVTALPHLMQMRVVDGRQTTEQQAIELPAGITLGQARILAERLGTARELKVDTVLAQRVYEPPRRPGSVYESTREMARRLIAQQEK